MMSCPNNVSIVISSLISSNDSPGIIVGKGKMNVIWDILYIDLFKVSDGINEYVAISSNGGRLWRLVNFVFFW